MLSRRAIGLGEGERSLGAPMLLSGLIPPSVGELIEPIGGDGLRVSCGGGDRLKLRGAGTIPGGGGPAWNGDSGLRGNAPIGGGPGGGGGPMRCPPIGTGPLGLSIGPNDPGPLGRGPMGPIGPGPIIRGPGDAER